MTRGADNIDCYNKTPGSSRKWCKRCGGHLFTGHPGMGLVDVYAALILQLTYRPALHVHYQEAVLPIRDGLPKLRGLPAEMGGSGQNMAE